MRIEEPPRGLAFLEDEPEHEDEKDQVRSHAYALSLFFFPAFRIPDTYLLPKIAPLRAV